MSFLFCVWYLLSLKYQNFALLAIWSRIRSCYWLKMIRRPLIFCILCRRPSYQQVSLHLEGNLRSPVCSLPLLLTDASSLLLLWPIALIISVHDPRFLSQALQILGRTSSFPTEGQHPCFLSYPPRLDLGRSLVCQLSPLAQNLSMCPFRCRVSDL